MLKKNKVVGLTGIDIRSLTTFIREKERQGTISVNKNGNFNIKKLTNLSIKWPGLNGLDLAKRSQQKNLQMERFADMAKGLGYKKSKNNLIIVAIDFGIKKYS